MDLFYVHCEIKIQGIILKKKAMFFFIFESIWHSVYMQYAQEAIQ